MPEKENNNRINKKEVALVSFIDIGMMLKDNIWVNKIKEYYYGDKYHVNLSKNHAKKFFLNPFWQGV